MHWSNPLKPFLLAAGLLAFATPAASGAENLLTVPGTVDPGQTVAVRIDAEAGGTLEVRGPDTGNGFVQLLGAFPVRGPEFLLTAPSYPGSYELHYLSAAGRLLAKTDLDVSVPPVSLEIPGPLGAGYDGRVLWRGPSAPGDMIQVYDPATRQVLSQAPAMGDTAAQNSVLVRMPEVTGNFQIRYWYGPAGAPLRAVNVTIGDGVGWLRSPIEVVAGKSFQVKWNGRADPGMEYQIVAPDGAVVARSPVIPTETSAEAADLRAPARPGDYRVRLVNTASGFIVADLPLDVDPR